MTNILLIILIVMSIILALVLVWVILEYKKLRQDYKRLSDDIERTNKDIAGLCSAAVSVDNRIVKNDEQLKELVEKVIEYEQNGQDLNQPYFSAIQRVRQGATAEELVQQCSLSREEAELLIRLHG